MRKIPRRRYNHFDNRKLNMVICPTMSVDIIVQSRNAEREMRVSFTEGP
jgi:hypothetical protein